MKSENGLQVPTLANLANLANYNLKVAKQPTDEQLSDNTVAESRKRDPGTRLRSLAGKYRLDPDRVLEWYRQDMDMIQTMDDATLDELVRDYAANKDTFTGKSPYETYQLWFYKIGKQPGLTRQGVMTTDKSEALKRLEAIYGAGNVSELHKKGEEHVCNR